MKTKEEASKICLYLLVFLLPIFFLPGTPNVLDFPKQTLLIFLTVIALSIWLLRCLVAGKIKLKLSPLNFIILFYLIFLALSSFLSLWPYGSFFGQPVTQLTFACGFLTTLALLIFYFLISHVFKKEEVLRVLILLGLSSLLAILFSCFQIFGRHFLPFEFAKSPFFHTVGSLKSAILFAACFLPLIFSLIFVTKKLTRIFFIAASLIFLIFLFLTNYWLGWILLLIGSAALLLFGISKRELFPPGFAFINNVLFWRLFFSWRFPALSF